MNANTTENHPGPALLQKAFDSVRVLAAIALKEASRYFRSVPVVGKASILRPGARARRKRGLSGRFLGALLSLSLSLNATPQLPELGWSGKRSDWLNVKTDVTPAAVGDGVTDDQPALQAALDMLASGTGSYKVLYLPPGTYRITDTLQLTNTTGNAIIGHGRDTVILWDGAGGGRMFWSDGASRQRFIGIVWDGQGTAAVGVDHDASSLGGTGYNLAEVFLLHRHEEFRGFTDAGVRIGESQGAAVASYEMQFYNCLFRNNHAGVKILWANDYNNLIQGCDFLDNTYGVYADLGNYNLYNCHFERSATADVYASSHASSIRRCTSQDSYRFVYCAAFSSKNAHVIQDCWVDNWGAADGAVFWAGGGPVTIADCNFTNAPNSDSPVQFSSPANRIKRVISSNNQYAPATTLVKALGATQVTVTEVTGRALGGIVTGPMQSFFTDVDARTVPTGTIFDAKADYGAVGNGSTDDTLAIQNCITAARNAGNGAVAYIPNGWYRITSTLVAPRGNYRIAGSGIRSQLLWDSTDPDGPLLQVDEPVNLTLEALAFGQVNNGTSASAQRIRQESPTGATSLARYDYLFFLGKNGNTDWNDPHCGIELLELPSRSTVLLDFLAGAVTLTDSSRANIVGNATWGPLSISNAAHYAKDGYAGFAFMNTAGMEVQDNQDLVVGDFYAENRPYILHVSGDGNTGSPGRVTLGGGGRMHTSGTMPSAEMVKVTDYAGRVFLGANICNPVTHVSPFQRLIPIFNHTGTHACDLTVAGLAFNKVPIFNMGTGGNKIVYANSGMDPENGNAELTIPETMPVGGLTPSAAAFDDFAELGAYHDSATWTPTQAPSGVSATTMSSSMIRIGWADDVPNADRFTVERSTDGVTYTEVRSVGANVTSLDNIGLNAGTLYYFRVCAYNLAGKGSYSSTVSATTPTGGGELRVQAESYSVWSGGSGMTVGPYWGGTWVNCPANSWLKFSNVNLSSGYSQLAAAYSMPHPGRVIELRRDSPTGPLLGTLNCNQTLDWSFWTESGTSLTGASGTLDLYLVFPQPVSIDYIKFLP